MDLNNRQTGKHATKPRALGLLGHSELYVPVIAITSVLFVSIDWNYHTSMYIFGYHVNVNLYYNEVNIIEQKVQ